MAEPEAIPLHPLAELFPPLPEEALADLAADIRTHGLRQPIVIYRGAILDGRNRDLACRRAAVDRRFDTFGGTEAEALDFVLSANLHRRHMTPSQLAMVGARIATLRKGRPGRKAEGIEAPVPISEAAGKLKVSPRAIKQARVVQDKGIPALVEAVESGRIEVKSAEKVARMTLEQQEAVLADIGDGKKPATAVKRAARTEKVRDLAGRAAQWPAGKYVVVYADPPWDFEEWGEGGTDRAPDNHYPVMSLADIRALDVPGLTAGPALLALWATAPLLPEALDLLRHWGFDYKSHLVWDKVTAGTGYWARSRHELLLIGTKGDLPAPVADLVPPSLHAERKTEHSRKPDRFAEILEGWFPGVPKVELFRRGDPRPGWHAWGNEALEAATSPVPNKPDQPSEYDDRGDYPGEKPDIRNPAMDLGEQSGPIEQVGSACLVRHPGQGPSGRPDEDDAHAGNHFDVKRNHSLSLHYSGVLPQGES